MSNYFVRDRVPTHEIRRIGRKKFNDSMTGAREGEITRGVASLVHVVPRSLEPSVACFHEIKTKGN